MKKRILTLLLSLAMICSSGSISFATDTPQMDETETLEVVTADAEPEIVTTSEEESSEVKIGDIIWIKSGSLVLKDYTNTNKGSHQLWGNYEVKVTEIIKDENGNISWYKFEFVNLGLGEVLLAGGGYKYVKVENTSAAEPEVDTDDGLEEPYIDYTASASNGVDVTVSAPEGAFPEGTTISVTETSVSKANIQNIVSKYASGTDVLGMTAVDISFGGTQPEETVVLRLTLPREDIPETANKVLIVHLGEKGAEIVSDSYLTTDASDPIISAAVDGFSSYVAVYVNGKYNAQKMSSVLTNNTRYSIAEFEVDLFDYDPETINNALNSVTSDNNGFHFTGYGIANMGSNNGINNSASTHAKQGIVKETLTMAGLPEFNYLTGADAGVNTGKVLFSDSEYTDKKTTYNDIPFEFVYDNTTGYYEYKSSANHAQLNETGDKIELYADTLSTENSYVATLDLSTANGTSDYTSMTTASNSFKATVSDKTGNDRLDPYVVFTVNDVEASQVGQIYVKAKIPSSVGSNKFQLFFTTDKATGMSEDKSFGNPTYSKEIPYTANGDWIEFVIDTSENSNWKDTITAVRVDLFDSNKGNLNLNDNYAIEISEIRFIRKDYGAYATYGGFYPFSQIEHSYPGNNTAFNLDAWGTLLNEDDIATVRASRAIFNPNPSSEDKRYAELAYGMVMEFDFYIPVDEPENPLTYYFNGDDDLWVFVDDQLVLDIGGGHGAITGSVNFTTGKRSVENANTVTGYNAGADQAYAPINDSISEELYSPGKHTMKVFYLERGGSVSNCYMKFNLPQTPQGSVSVSKEVKELHNADLSVLENEVFHFQIKGNECGANGEELKTPLDFDIVSADGSKSNGTTDSEGKFVLKHGQTANFYINENTEVTVIESPKEISGYAHVSTKINNLPEEENASKYEFTQITAKNTKLEYNFTNTYDEQEVTFTYIPVNPADCPDNVKGTVELTGKEGTKTYEKTGVSEEVGVRTGTPAGSTAVSTAAVKFVGWYSDKECTKLVSEGVKLTEDKLGKDANDLWAGGTYYAKFEYMYGDLTITKAGISDVDNHEENTHSNQEQQSTIYTVSGTSYSGVQTELEVVIVGNGIVTIKHLPVGEYTVTENENWSWRYTAKDNSQKTTVLEDNPGKVFFENTRNELYWLSGDNYCENWWTLESGVVKRDKDNTVINSN